MKLSMSALPRTFACPASAVLPHRDYQTSFADDGNDRHAEMEDAVINKQWDKLPPQVAEIVQRFPDVYPELVLVYDRATDTARTADKQTARQYRDLGVFEIPGTTDIACVDRANRRGAIVDWKGWEEVGAPEVNTQTTGYAIALARVFDLDEVTVAISYLGEGKQHTEIAVLDEMDFLAFAERLRNLDLAVSLAAKNPEANTQIGRQCRWCPAFHGCPAQFRLSAEIETGVALAKIESSSLDDDAAAAKAYEFMLAVGVFHKRVRDAVYSRAGQRPIPLASGKVLGRVEKRGNEQLDADTVYKVVRAKHGQPIADMAVQRVATKTKLKEAMTFVGGKSAKASEGEVLDEVRKLGGVSRRAMSYPIEECEPEHAISGRVEPQALRSADAALAEASS